ncbi:MAG: rhodanese-like domain-containing protein [Desulfomonilaceae bacterium]
MKEYILILVRAALILVCASFIGLGVNLISPKSLPWKYTPPKEVEVRGVKVPLIDEQAAFRLFGSDGTIFLDTRKNEDYSESHVQGAIFITPEEKEELFPVVQPLLPEEARLILYCYGPECDMAEQVADFLAQLGYTNMMIMSAGFRAWEKAGHPVEGKGK